MLIECKPYHHGGKVFIMTEKIQHFVQADCGSRITLTDGKMILVGDWPEDLATKIKESNEQN